MASGVRASGLKRPRKKSSQSVAKRTKVTSMVPTSTFSVPRLRNYSLGGSRKVTMIYHERFDLNPGAAVLASRIYRANSCFDPTYAIGGHQPRGFDQLMALYDHGTVIASKIDVGAVNNNSIPATFSVSLRDNPSAFVAFDDALEVPTCSWTISNTANGGGVVNLSQTCSVKKFLGRPNVMSEDNLRFTSTADCSEQCFYHINLGPTDGSSDLGSVPFHVRIEYTVILTEPTMPTLS